MTKMLNFFTVKEVFYAMEHKSLPNSRFLLGELILSKTDTLKLFKVRGIKCTSCGVSGKYFNILIDINKNGKLENLPYLKLIVSDGNYMTKDHIIPASLGGGNTSNNFKVCCYFCNSKKGNDISDIYEYFKVLFPEKNLIV